MAWIHLITIVIIIANSIPKVSTRMKEWYNILFEMSAPTMCREKLHF